jgi:hypothetical protein
MTKVKKTKKPKAKKVGKKSVSKTLIGSARVEKIDPRLRPTPPPKLIKVDPMLFNPLKISDNQRSKLISDVPIRMFSGQETGNFNRQFDILTSKEQQLESKLSELQKNNLKNEINSNLRDLSNDINNLNNDPIKTMAKIKKLQEKLQLINRLIPIGETSLITLYQNLNERLDDIFEDIMQKKVFDDLKENKQPGIFDRMKSYFGGDLKETKPSSGDLKETKPSSGDLKETKSSNTLLDDKISKNSLVDEAEIIKDNIKSKSGLQYIGDSSDDDEEITINFFDK